MIPDSPLKGDASKTTDLRRLIVCTRRLDLALILASLRFSLVTPMADFLEVQIYVFLLVFQIKSEFVAIYIKKLN